MKELTFCGNVKENLTLKDRVIVKECVNISQCTKPNII